MFFLKRLFAVDTDDCWNWQRHDEFAAPLKELPFSFLEFSRKVPRQNQEVIWPFASGLFFGDDRDSCSDGVQTPLVFVSLRSGPDELAVKIKVLKQGVPLGRGTVDVDLFAVENFFLNEKLDSFLDSFDPLGECLVGLGRIKTKVGLVQTQAFKANLGTDWCLNLSAFFVLDVDPEASTVDVVDLDIENLKAVTDQEVFQGSEGIVLQMFVTDVVKSVLGQHQR